MSRSIVVVAAGMLSLSAVVASGPPSTPASVGEIGVANALTAKPAAVEWGFLDPRRVSQIELPERASAATAPLTSEFAAQRALVRNAEADLFAAAEVRRRAEELSRRFVSDHGLIAEPPPLRVSPLIEPASSPTVRAAGGSTAQFISSHREPSPEPGSDFSPEQPPRSVDGPAAVVPSPGSVDEPVRAAPDLLALARRQVAEAEARALSERAARLAAERDSQQTIERAAAAMAKAQGEARAASRRAVEAEARALKATAAARQRTANTTVLATTLGKEKVAGGAASSAAVAVPAQTRVNATPSPSQPAAGPANGRVVATKSPGGFLSAGSIVTSPPPPTFSLGAMLGLQK